MIKFFRKIRQKLLVENRFNKYLIYAIGEIILVVIGILIALQINNWNENRKSENRANEITEKLKVEISEIINYLEFTNKGIEDQLSYLEKILTSNEKNIDSILPKTRYKLSPIFYLTSYSQFFDPPSDVYETAINDGSILLIKNKKLTRELQMFNKSIKLRLDEIIKEEYKQSREINDYISTEYASFFKDKTITTDYNWDKEVTKDLILKLKNDGKIKYMLVERIAFKKARQRFILMYKNDFETLLKEQNND